MTLTDNQRPVAAIITDPDGTETVIRSRGTGGRMTRDADGRLVFHPHQPTDKETTMSDVDPYDEPYPDEPNDPDVPADPDVEPGTVINPDDV